MLRLVVVNLLSNAVKFTRMRTRAEIEDIRGVAVSKGTVDALMEVGWVRIRGRKRTPGRPVTYGTTDDFLVHFGLENVGHLPGTDPRLEGRRAPG